MDKMSASELVFLLLNLKNKSKLTWESFVLCGCRPECIVLENNAFLPEGIYTIFECFDSYENYRSLKKKEKPLDINRIPVPDLWRVRRAGSKGEIYDGNILRGRVGLKEYNGIRCVEYIDWLDHRENRLYRDNYNRYGKLHSRTVYTSDDMPSSIAYYDFYGNEIITEIKEKRIFITHLDGVDRIYSSLAELGAEFIKRNGLENRRFLINSLHHPFVALRYVHKNKEGDILFWQEDIESDIPGRLKSILDRKDAFITSVFVDREYVYELLKSANEHNMPLAYKGYVYDDSKKEGIVDAVSKEEFLHLDILRKNA